MDHICLLRTQDFGIGTHSSLAADVPLIQMFLLCLTHCCLCPLRFGSKQMGQEPCALGFGCPILILRAVISLPSVCAREKGCKDKFPLLSVAVGPHWPPGHSRRRTEVASEAGEFWFCWLSGKGAQSLGAGGSWPSMAPGQFANCSERLSRR